MTAGSLGIYIYHILFHDHWNEKVGYINCIEAITMANVRHPHSLPVQKFGRPHLLTKAPQAARYG